jgi:arthrofactin-type cyclic lipopeptide synthetase C
MVRIIRSKQPIGPYRLAGWSFGGVLAYEISAQLINADQEVEYLALIDSYINLGRNIAGVEREFNARKALLDLLKRKLNEHDHRHAILKEIEEDPELEALPVLMGRLKERFLALDHLSEMTEVQLRNWLAQIHTIGVAAARYSPPEIPVAVHIFAAQDELPNHYDRGWRRVLPGNMYNIVTVPGTHYSMVKKPNVQALGQQISQSISLLLEG